MTEKIANRKRNLIIAAVLIAIVIVAGVVAAFYLLPGQTGDKTPIKIGVTAELSGAWSKYGPYQVAAYQLAVDAINEAGGVLGRPLELVVADTKTTAEGSYTACQKLLNVDNVVIVLGESSSTVPTLLPMFIQAKCALITPWAGSATLDNATGMGTYGFRACVSDSFPYVVLAKYMYQNLTKRTMAILAPDNLDEIDECTLFKQEFEKLGGQVVKWIDCASGQMSYESELRQAFELDPDIVHMPFNQADAVIAFRDWYTIGSPSTQWSCGNNFNTDPELHDVTPEPGILEGMIDWTGGARLGLAPDETTRAFLNAYTEHIGADLQHWSQPNCWDLVTLAAISMEAAGNATRAGILSYLTQVSNPPGIKVYSFPEAKPYLEAGKEINYEGASGPIDFNQKGNTPGKIQILKVTNDTWTLVTTVANY